MFVLQNFPFISEDFDALTYYQMLCKVVGYLNKLFPAEVQAVKTAVKTAVGDLEVAVAIAAAKLRK